MSNWEECGPCPVFASYTLALALQLREKHSYRLCCVYDLSRVLHVLWQMPYKRAKHISQMFGQLVGTASNVAPCRHHSDSLFVNFQEPVVSWMP